MGQQPAARPLGSLAPAALRLSDDYMGTRASLSARVSFASDMDVPARVERGEPGQFASFTLPCRKSRALGEESSKKDTLKARMRRISDWTGSLSRKKRRLQVSQAGVPGEMLFDWFSICKTGRLAEGTAESILRLR